MADPKDATHLCSKCQDLFATKESLQHFSDVSDSGKGVYYGPLSELIGKASCALCSLIVKALAIQLSMELYTKGTSI